MRITQSSTLAKYQYNLTNIQDLLTAQQNRLSTGKKFQTPSDDPIAAADSKRLTGLIDQNTVYQKNITDGLNDTSVYEISLQNFSDKLLNIRDISLDATTQINFDKLPTIAENIKQLLGDAVQAANYEFDGRFAFSGTKTTRNAINSQPPATNNLPYELLQGTATATNPSGLSVIFKGNNNDRTISTSSTTSERTNPKPFDTFGANGTQVFDNIISVYNAVNYKPDGTARTNNDGMTASESQKLADTIKNLSDSNDKVTSEIGRLGNVQNRLQVQSDQITNENTKLRDLRSLKEDTDVADAVLQLQKYQTGLTATLKVGATMFQTTLIDLLR